MAALLDFERFKNSKSTPNFDHAMNPNKIGYLNVKVVSDIESTGVGQDGVKLRSHPSTIPVEALQADHILQNRWKAPPKRSFTSRWISAVVGSQPARDKPAYWSANTRARISRKWLHL